ncbi:tetratricopeptide repeat protein [Flavobacterium sp.]|uniref:tetratricopeptide repeat protein n=1 Tax=Flavobacterium sp. TaxID=239 RepID=UPI004047167C
MTSKTPTIRQSSWFAILPQFGIMLLFIFLFSMSNLKDPSLFALITYFFIAMSLRNFVPKSHREGIKLTNKKRFEAAIPKFENSYAFFTKNNWIDKYRYLTLFSSSRMSYREMALCNIAFCYSQIENGTKALEYYEKAQHEFLDSGLALAGINMLKSIGKE